MDPILQGKLEIRDYGDAALVTTPVAYDQVYPILTLSRQLMK